MTGQRAIDLIRLLRHDFGNHLQVISGYLDLGRSDEVKKYIQSIVLDMSEERMIFDSCSADAALYFFEQLLLARERGIKLLYENIDISSLRLLESRQEPLHSVIRVAQDWGGNAPLRLSVREDEHGVLMVFHTDQQEEPVIFKIVE